LAVIPEIREDIVRSADLRHSRYKKAQ